MGRLRRQKKHFKGCAHVGFGSFCHRCEQDKKAEHKPRSESNVSKIVIASETLDTSIVNEKSLSKSKISNIEVRPAKDVFGENAYSPDRPVIVVWAENGARLPLMVPLGARYENGKWSVLDSKKYNASISYDRSKFGAFVKKYGSAPVLGLKVETVLNGREYLIIVV